MLKFYGYKKCGTSRKGEKALEELNVRYDFIDITEHPPSRSELKKIVKLSGEPATKFFNTSGGEYRRLELKDKISSMEDDEIINLLASNGRLIKRPLVTDGSAATVGYSEDHFRLTWST